MEDCQNYGPFLGPYYSTGPNTGPNLGDPKRDHNFDNLPYDPYYVGNLKKGFRNFGNLFLRPHRELLCVSLHCLSDVHS